MNRSNLHYNKTNMTTIISFIFIFFHKYYNFSPKMTMINLTLEHILTCRKTILPFQTILNMKTLKGRYGFEGQGVA